MDAIDRARDRYVRLSAATQRTQETAEGLSTAIEPGQTAMVSVSAAIETDFDASLSSLPPMESASKTSVRFSIAVRGDPAG